MEQPCLDGSFKEALVATDACNWDSAVRRDCELELHLRFPHF